MIRKLLLLMGCTLFGVLSIVILFIVSSRLSKQKGSFVRITPPHSLMYINDVHLPGGNFYFAGIHGNDFYLANTKFPDRLLQLDSNLSNAVNIRLILPGVRELFNVKTVVTPRGQVYVTDGMASIIMKAKVGDSVLTLSGMNNYRFIKAFPWSDSTFVFQLYDSVLKQTIYQKANMITGKSGQFTYVPEVRGDGIFSVDGMLLYDGSFLHPAFIYYYRNKIEYLDSNLNIKFRSETIDSNDFPKINLIKQTQLDQTGITAASVLVNKAGFIEGTRLYINSLIVAANENTNILTDQAIIDVYSIKDGHYIQSIYAENFRNRHLTGFRIDNEIFTGLYGDYIARFHITRVRSDKQ